MTSGKQFDVLGLPFFFFLISGMPMTEGMPAFGSLLTLLSWEKTDQKII